MIGAPSFPARTTFTVPQTFPRVKNESLSDPYGDLPGDASPFPYIYTPSAPRFLPPSAISGIARNFLPAYSFQLNATLAASIDVDSERVGGLRRFAGPPPAGSGRAELSSQ